MILAESRYCSFKGMGRLRPDGNDRQRGRRPDRLAKLREIVESLPQFTSECGKDIE